MNYIIFDLEATCWKESQGRVSEIIEIGAVKLDSNIKVINEFNKFIKPVLNPELSDFCTTLTSIRQSDVDGAEFFETVIKDFEQWILLKSDRPVLLSWGYYDKDQLISECKHKHYKGPISKLLKKHYSLKHEYSRITRSRPCGMDQALQILRIPLTGTHHRAIDDTRNITKIFERIHAKLNL